MLRAIDSKKADLGVTGYGLSVTTMEEVFLRISEGDSLPPSSIPVVRLTIPRSAFHTSSMLSQVTIDIVQACMAGRLRQACLFFVVCSAIG